MRTGGHIIRVNLRMKRLIPILALMALAGVLLYRFLPPAAEERQAAVALSRVKLFDFFGGGLEFVAPGYEPPLPDGQKAFFEILSSRRASLLFREAFEMGTPEGKIYALAGLHATDRSSYRQCAARFLREKPATVRSQHGCLVESEQASDLVFLIEQGGVDRYLKSSDSHAR